MHVARVLRFAVVAAGCSVAATPALAEPARTATSAGPAHGPVSFAPACHGPGRHCFAQVAMQDGTMFHFAAPPYGEIAAHSPAELQAMYHIDPSRGTGMTVALIDAYGYPNLEADLGKYRKMFGLPPCTKANGCLRVVNIDGGTTLPTTQDDGWNVETALDVDMASAGCPRCNILVVEAEYPSDDLDLAQQTAARLGADVISNSWGSSEYTDDAAYEPGFDQTGVGVFASSGDEGYRAGPQYPATSLHVIAVGGTRVKDNIVAHTATETAWTLAGSSCSGEFAAPVFQPVEAACPMRAASDVAAIADPQTGVAIYATAAGGPSSAGGTSAASPLVAALMAGAGHPDATPAFIYRHPEAFTDITGGSNGTCGTTMCNAGSGWDGPTGVGSPNQALLVAIGNGVGPAVTITSPADGTTQTGAFTVEATVADGAAHVDLAIDGVRVIGIAQGPYQFSAPAIAGAGDHVVTVSAITADHDVGTASVTVHVPAAPAQPDAGVPSGDGGTSGGGDHGMCAAGASSGGGIWIVGAALAMVRRRRRAR